MRCPFAFPAVPFFFGLIFYRAFPPVISCHALFFILPALGLSWGRKAFIPLLCAAWFLLGGLLAHADRFRPPEAVENFTASEAWVEGAIVTLPDVKMKGKRRNISFVLEAEKVSRKKVSGKVQVYLINPKSIPHAGDRVLLLGRLEAPRSFNSVFDYAVHLKSQGITASFQGIGWRSCSVLGRTGIPWTLRIQEIISGKIEKYASGQAAVIFKALVLGTRAGLDPDVKESFFRSGTSHLLAISGLNIALVAGTFYLLLIACGLGRTWAAAAGAAVAAFQALVAGMGFPVVRAAWMAAAGFFGIVLDRPKQSLNIFFMALLCVLLPDTRAVENVSFQLSFLSVLSMIVFFPLWEEWRWKDLWAVPLAVTAGTLPVVLRQFGGISTVSWAANLLAVPLFHFTLLGELAGLCLFWFPGAGVIFFGLASLFLKLALAWIRFCAAGQWSYVTMPQPSWGMTAAYYLLLAGLIILLRFRRARKRSGAVREFQKSF